MNCPECDNERNKVLDSRGSGRDNATIRRRQCLRCSFRWTTYERREEKVSNLHQLEANISELVLSGGITNARSTLTRICGEIERTLRKCHTRQK